MGGGALICGPIVYKEENTKRCFKNIVSRGLRWGRGGGV